MARKGSVLPTVIAVHDLDAALDTYTRLLGYRLDMTFPADSPTVAVVSGYGRTIRLESDVRSSRFSGPATYEPTKVGTPNAEWVTGRAGMEYRDLIPGRLGGKVIASHIRIPNGGEVADYVHYHKVLFQMIYCVTGAIRVVYEDQGPPFWLRPGDCVLQPPEIRHRVLEAEANSEVVEIGSPAIHETWVDHELKLPTQQIKPDRLFSGQLFVHHVATDADWTNSEFDGFESREIGIAAASNDAARVFEMRAHNNRAKFDADGSNAKNIFYFVLAGGLTAASESFGESELTPGDSILIPPLTEYRLDSLANSAILCVVI